MEVGDVGGDGFLGNGDLEVVGEYSADGGFDAHVGLQTGHGPVTR